jgi:DNA invertase Pin-like site-specific DNA recombinase
MPGKDIGYVRVSTHEQNTARQLDCVARSQVSEHITKALSEIQTIQKLVLRHTLVHGG